MKLLTSEIDAETERWPSSENDLCKRARSMSQMAFSMYQFTRGEGELKTTQVFSLSHDNLFSKIVFKSAINCEKIIDLYSFIIIYWYFVKTVL